MTLLSVMQVIREYRAPKHPSTQSQVLAARKTIIELILAGRDMAERLTLPADNEEMNLCICGGTVAEHAKFCPVERYYRAVDAVRTAAL